MENLNAEQVKDNIEYCIEGECENCPYDEETSCREYLLHDSLALINSQDQRIEAYRQELAEVRVALAEANKEREELTEVVKRSETAQGCKESVDNGFSPSVTELQRENERLMRDKTALECIVGTARNQARADTVRKMQERLKSEIAKYFLPTFRFQANAFIDQIAKEMLEGDK